MKKTGMNDIDGGEVILEAFRQLGVEYIFSSPGSEWSPVWEALSRQDKMGRAGPKFIQCWHEMVAADMATGFALLTGRMPVVLLHAAAGTLHATLALNCAYRGEVPMLVLSGESITLGEDASLKIEGQWYSGVSVGGVNQQISSLVKWSQRVPSAPTLYQSIIRAGEMAVRSPAGPVHLDVPLEYMLQRTAPGDGRHIEAPNKRVPLAEDVAAVAAELSAAKNPVVLAEQSGLDPEAFSALCALCEKLGMPVISVPRGSVVNFPQDHPLWLGSGTYDHLRSADLVLMVAPRTPWYPPSERCTSGRIIALSDHLFKGWLVYQNLQADRYLEGDVARTLSALEKAIVPSNADVQAIQSRHKKWAEIHTQQQGSLSLARRGALATDALNVLSISEILREVMPADTIYVDETITHSPALRNHLPLNQPQSFFRHPGQGLGQGIGLALGIKLAAADRPTVLLVGDGSFLYNPIVQAFGASAQYELPILIMVFNNGGYISMGQGHELYYPGGDGVAAGLPYGVNIPSLPLEQLGSPFGFRVARITTASAFRDELPKAMASIRNGKSAVINLVMERR